MKIKEYLNRHGIQTPDLNEAIARKRDERDPIAVIIGDIAAFSDCFIKQDNGPGSYSGGYDHWSNTGSEIIFDSYLGPNSISPGVGGKERSVRKEQWHTNNGLFSAVVDLTTAYSPAKQREILDTLRSLEDSPAFLNRFREHCLKAEFAMEMFYCASAINEIRARKYRGRGEQVGLPTANTKFEKLKAVLEPTTFLAHDDDQHPKAPFKYIDNYNALAQAELALLNRSFATLHAQKKMESDYVGPDTQLIVAGSGPLPLTALLIHIQTGASIACVDASMHSCLQQSELIHRLEELDIIGRGAITVIHENPAFIDYQKYIGKKGGLKKAPDGIIATYFARSLSTGSQPDYYPRNEKAVLPDKPFVYDRFTTPLLTYPLFTAPVESVIHQAARAGAKVANIRDASGLTNLLYEPFVPRHDDMNAYATITGRFIPDNKDTQHKYASDAAITVEHGMHNSALGVLLDPEAARAVKPRMPESYEGYKGIVTDAMVRRAHPAHMRVAQSTHHGGVGQPSRT